LPPFVIQPDVGGAVSSLAVNFGGAAGARCATAWDAASMADSAARQHRFREVFMARRPPTAMEPL
jgi:hypothetical protein